MPRNVARRSERTVRSRDVEPEEDYEEDDDLDDEEEEDEEPPARRSRERAAAQRRHPAGRSRRSDDEDDDEDDEEEEERPARRSRTANRRPGGRSDSERPGRRGRNQRSFDEGADEGRRSRRRNRDEDGEDGWDEFHSKVKKAKFADNFKVGDDDEIVIKFVENKPITTYYEHWIQEATGKKSHVCLGEDCPLCDIGDEPRARIPFNVISFANAAKPELVVWTTGIKVAQKIEGLNKNKRTGPVNRDGLYWAITKTGKGTKTEYNLQATSEDDLEKYYDITPLSDDEVAEFEEKKYDKSLIKVTPREDLEELVDDIS